MPRIEPVVLGVAPFGGFSYTDHRSAHQETARAILLPVLAGFTQPPVKDGSCLSLLLR